MWVRSLSLEDHLEEENGNPLQFSCLKNSIGKRSLEGCSPWACKESNATKQLSTHGKYEVVSHNKPCSFKCAVFYMAFFCV